MGRAYGSDRVARRGVASVGIVTTDFNPLTGMLIRMPPNLFLCSLPFKKTMANTYHQVYLQTIFAVKYRNAVIDKAWKARLLGVVGNLINETGCKTLIVNGVEDHIHCLIGLKPVVSISELMKTVKAKSSKYVNDHSLTTGRFEWQTGYGVFSYAQSQLDRVYNYIRNQEAHHQKQVFRDEYLNFLKKFKIEYDENYIFWELM